MCPIFEYATVLLYFDIMYVFSFSYKKSRIEHHDVTVRP